MILRRGSGSIRISRGNLSFNAFRIRSVEANFLILYYDVLTVKILFDTIIIII